jgi:hypothetical protein
MQKVRREIKASDFSGWAVLSYGTHYHEMLDTFVNGVNGFYMI